MSELRLFRRVAIDFKTRRVLFDLPPERACSPAVHHDRHLGPLTAIPALPRAPRLPT